VGQNSKTTKSGIFFVEGGERRKRKNKKKESFNFE
jgi:hypothetical protein